jgi:hypothetical protein
MVSGAGRRAVAVIGTLAVVGGGAVIARADQAAEEPCLPRAGGGLALCAPNQTDMSMTVTRTAQAGAVDKVFVLNNSATALDVTAKARPWIQSAGGAVSPNRRGTLGGVSVSDQAFSLAPGARKELTVTLNNAPAYLYGALEVIGLPSDLSKRKGVVAGYRLVSALRYNAGTATYGLKAGTAKVSGKGSAKTLTLPVRNTGNTIAPVTGRVSLKGPLGTKNSSIKSTRILPGKSVSLGLAAARSLRAGSYRATVSLTQNKKTTKFTKKITVRR